MRSILSISWRKKIMNEYLWRRTEQQPLEVMLKSTIQKWIEHTLKERESNVTGTTTECDHEGKRKRGRTVQTWRHSLLAELKTERINTRIHVK